MLGDYQLVYDFGRSDANKNLYPDLWRNNTIDIIDIFDYIDGYNQGYSDITFNDEDA